MSKAQPHTVVPFALNFTDDDLAANRDGYMTKGQRARLNRIRCRWRGSLILATVVAIASLIHTFVGESTFVVVSIVAAGFAIYSWWKLRKFNADLYKGDVRAVSGLLELRSYKSSYTVWVGKLEWFDVPSHVYRAFAAVLYKEPEWTLYFAPQSKTLLSAEPQNDYTGSEE